MLFCSSFINIKFSWSINFCNIINFSWGFNDNWCVFGGLSGDLDIFCCYGWCDNIKIVVFFDVREFF